MSILNRNDIQETVLDPETNFLQSVRFFLEPLNDGSLPAFQIQQEIFKTLTRLPVERDVLLSSGMGKVVLFYTRSSRPSWASSAWPSACWASGAGPSSSAPTTTASATSRRASLTIGNLGLFPFFASLTRP